MSKIVFSMKRRNFVPKAGRFQRIPFFDGQRRSFSFPGPMTRLFSTAESPGRMPSPLPTRGFGCLISCK